MEIGNRKCKAGFTPTPICFSPGSIQLVWGFTLVEVLLTVTILAIGIIGVLRAYTTSVNALKVARCSIDAVCLLKEKMAEINQDAIENLGISTGVAKGKFEGEYGSFKWESEVSTLDLNIEDLKEELKDCLNELKITVVNERIKPVRRFTLVTYVENYVEEKE